VWEKVHNSAADAEEYNLDRKQVVLSTLMTLARATECDVPPAGLDHRHEKARATREARRR